MTSSIKQQSIDLSKMTFAKYGKGFLVKPPSGFKFSEEAKYFHGGWWMPSQQQWFFKKTDFETFQPLMKPNDVGRSTKRNKLANMVIADTDKYMKKKQMVMPLKDYTYSVYKKGYLLSIKESMVGKIEFPEDYKYYHGTWWMESQNAWFFTKDMLPSIESMGCVKEGDEWEAVEADETEWEAVEAVEAEWEAVEADEAEWDADEADPIMEDSGSEYIPDEDDSTEDTSEDTIKDTVEWDLHTMNKHVEWEKYGKGWLVTPVSHYHLYGQKYLNGGWWMPTQNGWFFRDHDFTRLGLK